MPAFGTHPYGNITSLKGKAQQIEQDYDSGIDIEDHEIRQFRTAIQEESAEIQQAKDLLAELDEAIRAAKASGHTPPPKIVSNADDLRKLVDRREQDVLFALEVFRRVIGIGSQPKTDEEIREDLKEELRKSDTPKDWIKKFGANTLSSLLGGVATLGMDRAAKKHIPGMAQSISREEEREVGIRPIRALEKQVYSRYVTGPVETRIRKAFNVPLKELRAQMESSHGTTKEAYAFLVRTLEVQERMMLSRAAKGYEPSNGELEAIIDRALGTPHKRYHRP